MKNRKDWGSVSKYIQKGHERIRIVSIRERRKKPNQEYVVKKEGGVKLKEKGKL